MDCFSNRDKHCRQSLPLSPDGNHLAVHQLRRIITGIPSGCNGNSAEYFHVFDRGSGGGEKVAEEEASGIDTSGSKKLKILDYWSTGTLGKVLRVFLVFEYSSTS